MKRQDTTTIRRVWALLTQEPNIAYREISRRLGLRSSSTAFYHVCKLEELGYVHHEPGTRGTRVILMPFCIIPRRADPQARAESRRVYNRFWMQAHRTSHKPARVEYECICGKAGKRGGCKRCGESFRRYGEVRPPRGGQSR